MGVSVNVNVQPTAHLVLTPPTRLGSTSSSSVTWLLRHSPPSAAAPAFTGSNIKWLAGAFAVEKVVYVVVWIMWHSGNSIAQLYSKDVFAGVFFSIYGVNDFVFMLFFAWVFLNQSPAD